MLRSTNKTNCRQKPSASSSRSKPITVGLRSVLLDAPLHHLIDSVFSRFGFLVTLMRISLKPHLSIVRGFEFALLSSHHHLTYS